MGIVAAITAAFDFGAKLLGFQSKKLELKNTPEMQEAKQRQDEQAAADAATKAVAEGDMDKIKKGVS